MPPRAKNGELKWVNTGANSKAKAIPESKWEPHKDQVIEIVESRKSYAQAAEKVSELGIGTVKFIPPGFDI
jgi:hypothetical protein